MKSSQRADELMAQVEWKGMCLDIRGRIVARGDDTGTRSHTQGVRCGKNASTEADCDVFLAITAIRIIQFILRKIQQK